MKKKLFCSLMLTVALIGCADLKEVRDFAGESAKLAAYTDFTDRFRDTYEREKPYLFGKKNAEAAETDKLRKAAYEDLIKIHGSVTLYMKILAKLAGDETFNISNNLDNLAGAIKENPRFGIEDKQVDAYANIVKVIARWITSAAQQRAVQEMVTEGNKPLQDLLGGMLQLVDIYKGTHENEKGTVLGFYDVELPFESKGGNRILLVIARTQEQVKRQEYQSYDPKFDELKKGIKSISDGHEKLLNNVNNLSSGEVRALIEMLARDIQGVRKNLEILGS